MDALRSRTTVLLIDPQYFSPAKDSIPWPN